MMSAFWCWQNSFVGAAVVSRDFVSVCLYFSSRDNRKTLRGQQVFHAGLDVLHTPPLAYEFL